MVVAVAVIMLVSGIIATLLVLALREAGLSGQERQRAVSIASAEGRVDNLISMIDFASVSSLTDGNLCGVLPTYSTRVGPDPLTVSSSVTYQDVNGNDIVCTDVSSGAVEAVTAVISATTTSDPLPNKLPAVRKFETVVNLKLNVNMEQAIFGNAGVTITNNNTVINGAAGANNGDVYSNGYVNCKGHVYGSIYAQSTVTLENDCDWIAGNVWAAGNVTNTANSITVVGDIKTSGGSIWLEQLGAQANKVFNGRAFAGANVYGNVCPSAKCNPFQSVDPPPLAAFPEMGHTPGDEWNWKHGYTDISFPTCVAQFNDPASLGYWLKINGPTLTQNTVIRMPDDCTVDFTNVNGQVMELNKDVAIFARGSGAAANGTAFNFTGRPHFVGTPGEKKNLYMIQDYQAPDCTKTGIRVNNHVTAEDNIRLLLYTPHNFYSASGNSEVSGQIYSGCTVDLNNVMDLTYDPLPAIGVQNISAMSYSTEIVAKRETS